MDSLWRMMEVTEAGGLSPSIETIVISLLLSFVLGQLLAWTYCWTHSGLSYSRSFTQSLILMTLGVAFVMIIIGNNIITAFGLIGALALIRFRNVLKDTRDTVFVFLALAQGMAVGSERYATAITGAMGFLLVMLYLHWTEFGSRGHFDGYLRFQVSLESGPPGECMGVLRRYCRSLRQLAVQQVAEDRMTHCTYQVRLRHPELGHELVAGLEQMDGVRDVSLVMQQEIAEV